VVSAARRVHGIDVGRVEAAIRQAEARTSGEIRVAVSRFYFWGDVRFAAEGAFARLHMERTRHRNGVMIFVAPRRRQFVILGDAGIHARAGDSAWETIAGTIGAEFQRGDLTGGLERGVAAIGDRLAQHFPAEATRDANELPDELVVDGGGPIR
jgi:uncharacterized membrane protein